MSAGNRFQLGLLAAVVLSAGLASWKAVIWSRYRAPFSHIVYAGCLAAVFFAMSAVSDVRAGI